MDFCLKEINSKSRYSKVFPKKCHKEVGHSGKCEEYPFLSHIQTTYPNIKKKIVRDATMTTGASWKSPDAGPNRINRWVMQLDDATLLSCFAIDMEALSQITQDKLRSKAASYEECIKVSAKLAWLVYGMKNCAEPDDYTKDYLEKLFGPISKNNSRCGICKEKLDIALFSLAKRGRAELETCHLNPRIHNHENIAFGHRNCNIAQGDKTIDEFYAWIQGILDRKDCDTN